MKRAIISIILIAGALYGIITLLNKNKAENEAVVAAVAVTNEAVAVRVAAARRQSVNLAYLANGTFLPKQEVAVAAEAGGRVVTVLVEEGDRVAAGQTLALVEGDKIAVSLATAQAVYDNAAAEVARFESAFATGGVTRQQLDQIRLQLENAKNNLQNVKLMAGEVAIKTSVAGIVNARKIEPGSYVSPGTPAFDIVNISALKLRVAVDEKNVVGLRLGQVVSVGVSVFPDRETWGRITFIAPKSDGSLNFPVEIEVPNAAHELRAGMYGTAHFGDSETEEVLLVPRTAFVGSVSDNLVFLARDGKALAAKVASGRSFGDDIEVISGLQEGDQVVTTGQINLFDQTAISIIK